MKNRDNTLLTNKLQGMKRKKRFFVSLGCLLAFLPMMAQVLPYQNPLLSPTERAVDIVDRLTLNEKASLMQHSSAAVPRLGIKAYNWWNEACHGVARAGLATVYPQSIGMAASFDKELLFEVFTSVSDEARAKAAANDRGSGMRQYQGLTFWTPNINIFRDPRWGRGQETYGEDPYMAGQMGMAVVRGLQGPEESEYDKLHACAKHFAVHSGPEWNRHEYNAENIALRDLRETYLPAFKDLVQKANVKEIMCAYNRYEGEPCCGSDLLLNKILREEWGFDGVVVSDCWAINDFWSKGHHETHANAKEASASAVLSGTDLECGQNLSNLPAAVQDGLIKESDVDVSLRRVMKARFELGEMDEDVNWTKIPYSVVDCDEHKALALKMAQKSIVLLQNKNNILPLKDGLKIALMGPNANDSIMQWGNYNGTPSHTITLLEALQNRIPEADFIYELGCDHTSLTTRQSLINLCSFEGNRGFKATYWNNPESEGEPFAETYITTPFRFTTAGATTFLANVNIHNFSALYEAQFKPEKTGAVDIRLQTTGVVSFFINDTEIPIRSGMRASSLNYTLDVVEGETYHLKLKFAFPSTVGTTSLDFDIGNDVPVNLDIAVERVKDVDVVIFAGGISPKLEGEEMNVNISGFKGGDRTDIELPEVQRQLVAKLKAAGKKVVFVNFSGSAIALVPESENCEAIVQAWYPGQAGGEAVASVLYGEYNPAGKLPITFYKNIGQLPDFEDYSMKNRTYRYMEEKPLFAFGYGLSYTTFQFGKAKLSSKSIKEGKQITLTIPVSNIGKIDGEEVVQVYLRRPSDQEGPVRTLRAFERVAVPVGATNKVAITLNSESFEWFDASSESMRPLKGDYEILYGNSSDITTLQTIKVTYK